MKMFREDGNQFIIFALVALAICCVEVSSDCSQLTPCSCVFPDGYGYNLARLSTGEPLNATLANNKIIYFHPCSNTPLTNYATSECHKEHGVSACMVDGTTNSSVSLGTVEETKINVNAISKNPYLVLSHGNYSTTIDLNCCPDCTTKLYALADSDSAKHIHLLLVSQYVCKDVIHAKSHISTGSLLVIYFFVITGLYFVGGALALKMMRGATGVEMIPNYAFWSELPSLVREGIEYTFSCCSTESSYERL